jgi:hypothetical protein
MDDLSDNDEIVFQEFKMSIKSEADVKLITHLLNYKVTRIIKVTSLMIKLTRELGMLAYDHTEPSEVTLLANSAAIYEQALLDTSQLKPDFAFCRDYGGEKPGHTLGVLESKAFNIQKEIMGPLRRNSVPTFVGVKALKQLQVYMYSSANSFSFLFDGVILLYIRIKIQELILKIPELSSLDLEAYKIPAEIMKDLKVGIMKNIKFQIIESSVTDNKFPSSAVLLAKWFDRLRSKHSPETVHIMRNIKIILSSKVSKEGRSDILSGPLSEGSSDLSSDMSFAQLTYNTQNMREHGLRQGLRDELKSSGGVSDTGLENISDGDSESIDIKGSISYGNVSSLKPLMPLDPTVNDSIVFTNVDPSSLERYLEIDDPQLDELFVRYSQNSPGNRFVLKLFKFLRCKGRA